MLNCVEAKKDNKQGGREGCRENCKRERHAARILAYIGERCLSCLVLSCFFRVHCPSGRAFSGACRSRPTLYRAEHHTPVGRVLRSYALEPSRGIVRLSHMYCPSSTIKL